MAWVAIDARDNQSANMHICHFYRSRPAKEDFTRKFLSDGLANGEAVVYVAPRHDLEEWLAEVQDSGTDVEAALRFGKIQIFDPMDWYVPEEFSSIRMAERLWQTIAKPLRDFAGLRLLADMHWTTFALTPSKLCHWEATANVLFEGLPVQIVCQYDLHGHSLAELHAALRTHPFVRLDGRTKENPYNESEEILANEPFLNETDSYQAEVPLMLSMLFGQQL